MKGGRLWRAWPTVPAGQQKAERPQDTARQRNEDEEDEEDEEERRRGGHQQKVEGAQDTAR
jgi:ribosomal protein L12E/L44/L45/RPP1/RPP2